MKSILNYPHIGIFILAWFLADLLIPLLIRAAHVTGLLDRPGGHKGQKAPVPFFGGVAVFASFSIAIISTLRFESIEGFAPLIGLLVGGLICVVLGLIDDFRPVSAVVKLFVLFGITIVLSSSHIGLVLLPNVFFNLPNLIVTLLWIVGATSALNSIDNTDGVATGISAIAGIFVFVVAWGTTPSDAQPWLSYIAIGLVGSCFGMLRYNFHPARIYLGDNGSLFLGYTVAVMLVFAQYSADPLRSILIPSLIFSVPVFDIVLTTLLRVRDGTVGSIRESIVYCGRDHTAHLLMAAGFSKVQAVFALYGLAILGGIAALVVLAVPSLVLAVVTAIAHFLLLAGVGWLLGRTRRRVFGNSSQAPESSTDEGIVDWEEIDRIRTGLSNYQGEPRTELSE